MRVPEPLRDSRSHFTFSCSHELGFQLLITATATVRLRITKLFKRRNRLIITLLVGPANFE